MKTLEMCENELTDISKEMINTKNKVKNLRIEHSKIRNEKMNLIQYSVFSACAVLSSLIIFALNPASLPFIITGASILGLGSAGVVSTIVKNKKYDKKIEKLNNEIIVLDTKLDSLRASIDKKHGQIAEINKVRISKLKTLSSKRETKNITKNDSELER